MYRLSGIGDDYEETDDCEEEEEDCFLVHDDISNGEGAVSGSVRFNEGDDDSRHPRRGTGTGLRYVGNRQPSRVSPTLTSHKSFSRGGDVRNSLDSAAHRGGAADSGPNQQRRRTTLVLTARGSIFVDHVRVENVASDKSGLVSLESSGRSMLSGSVVEAHQRPHERPEQEYGDSDVKPVIDFLKDPSSEMTRSRRIALFLMRRYKWYYPALGTVRTSLANREDEKEPEWSEKRNSIAFKKSASVSLSSRGRSSVTSYLDSFPYTMSVRKLNVAPNLEQAWAYFEHFALPRRLVGENEGGSEHDQAPTTFGGSVASYIAAWTFSTESLTPAHPGENRQRTKLYDPLRTPHNQLGDWGIGMGLYFSTLRAIAVFTLLVGVLNVQMRNFYANRYGSPDRKESLPQGLFWEGTAICTDQQWVICTDECGEEDEDEDDWWHQNSPLKTTATANPALTFALRNNCNGAILDNALSSVAATLFLAVLFVGLYMYLKYVEVKFDEDEQTAQDYSIVIGNPPADAKSADEWKRYFFECHDGAVVTTCTIAVDNDLLIRTLVERREKLNQIQLKVEPDTPLDTLSLAKIAVKEERTRPFWRGMLARMWISPGIPELVGRLVALNTKVKGLAQDDEPRATKVFITFETESDQRKVLRALSMGSREVARNNINAVVDPKHLFRGQLVLRVRLPDEPNTICWQDLNAKFMERLKWQICTAILMCVAVGLMTYFTFKLTQISPIFATIMIAVGNIVFTDYAKFLTGLERHASESARQRSLYMKLVIFRWTNTAIVNTLITPFTSTIAGVDSEPSAGLVPKVYLLYVSEFMLTILWRLCDPPGHFRRHILAPRAQTQEAMNNTMRGRPIELAERYTDMTKLLFLAVWYSTIFPSGFFFCSATLFLSYFVDRVSLMRSWKRAPNFGPDISDFGFSNFFPLIVVAMAMMSSYYFSGFPFDNLCENVEDDSCPGSNNSNIKADIFVGQWELNNGNTAYVSSGDPTYRFCRQDVMRNRFGSRRFPFTSTKQPDCNSWMTDEQEFVSDVLGYFSLSVICAVGVFFLFTWLTSYYQSKWTGSYEPRGEDQGINFSDVPSMTSYVPQVNSPAFPYPLVACNVRRDETDVDMIQCDGQSYSRNRYDLTRDAEALLRHSHGRENIVQKCFSEITHWPPEKDPPEKKQQEAS